MYGPYKTPIRNHCTLSQRSHGSPRWSSAGSRTIDFVMRVQELQGNVSKRKQFLQRAGRSVDVVEFVAPGSRLRIYVPKESCLLTTPIVAVKWRSLPSHFLPNG
ncbi:hypothetical protein M514_03001, partial [Trichuris suis]|uniref:Uncharacterized protein n=1 Tax=Trichuris suis TaxID=68888 RepID=A0A085MG77_9BILA